MREPDFLVEKEPHLSAIVIKPTLIGSLQDCQKLIAQAHSLGIKAVITLLPVKARELVIVCPVWNNPE